MAKRRSLEIPSQDVLRQLETEFIRDGISPRPTVAPIAQVAAESALAIDPRSVEQRQSALRDQKEANQLREAREKGLVLLDLPLDQIDIDALVRDRISLSAEELEELKSSISRNGLRLPVEVFDTGTGYGLLSGYRRMMAMHALRELRGEAFGTVKAILRDPEAMGGSFAAMVEENEIRSSLSHFERGRIAVVAAQQGSFTNVEAAVEALFPVASKAKRSKIRSFALVYEELGDMLSYPEALTEKLGLRLATALREGAEAPLRMALAEAVVGSAEAEAEAIEAALQGLTMQRFDTKKGGRPKRLTVPSIRLSSGYELSAREEGDGWAIQVGGTRRVDKELIAVIMRELERLLDRPED